MKECKKVSRSLMSKFLRRYTPKTTSNLPKYAILRETILAALDDGFWPQGHRLPNEVTFAALTPYSLGTVQNAMRDLSHIGAIKRLRGRGTFVACQRIQMSSPLHFRFEDKQGAVLAVFPRIVARRACYNGHELAEFMKCSTNSILIIDRQVQIGSNFFIFSSMYVDANRFPLFVHREMRELEMNNLKELIRSEYNVDISRIKQALSLVRATELPDGAQELLGLAKSAWVSRLELHAIGKNDRGVYYQEMFIPPSDYTLRLSDWIPGL